MNVVNYVEVTADDGGRARIHADAVEVIRESKDGQSLTICTTRVTIKVIHDTLETFWAKLRAARGGIESMVHDERAVPPELRAKIPLAKPAKPAKPVKDAA